MPNSKQKLPSESQGPAPRPFFTRFSQQVSRYAGKPVTFFGAILVIVIWGATGPLFAFNDTWQLIINTSTTIVTFLMVFLIQNSQNRDTAALQIKLDELIARTEGPRNALLDLEDLDEEVLDRLRADYARLADQARGEENEGSGILSPERSISEICTPAGCVQVSATVSSVETKKPDAKPVRAKARVLKTPGLKEKVAVREQDAAIPAKSAAASRRSAATKSAVAKSGPKTSEPTAA